MADPGAYSRLVSILKIGLPLIALGLLTALFFTDTEEPAEDQIAFGTDASDQINKGLQVTNPTFTGSTRTNDRYRFVADLVVPDAAPPTRADVSGLTGTIDYHDGTVFDIAAERASLDLAGRMIELIDAVRIRTSDDMQVEAMQMQLDLASGVVAARTDIRAEAPMGHIEAETLEITPQEGEDQSWLFSFGNGVRLIYDPTTTAE